MTKIFFLHITDDMKLRKYHFSCHMKMTKILRLSMYHLGRLKFQGDCFLGLLSHLPSDPNSPNTLRRLGLHQRNLRRVTHGGGHVHEGAENELVPLLLVQIHVTEQKLLHEVPIHLFTLLQSITKVNNIKSAHTQRIVSQKTSHRSNPRNRH